MRTTTLVMGQPTQIMYTNHKGDYSQREIIPVVLRYGTSEYHTEPQWLLECWDLHKEAIRTFSLSEIHTE